jgi:hypothetical protein
MLVFTNIYICAPPGVRARGTLILSIDSARLWVESKHANGGTVPVIVLTRPGTPYPPPLA